MRLLVRDDILRMLGDPGAALRIGNFSAEHLQHTSYYIRVGRTFIRSRDGWFEHEEMAEGNFISLRPGEFVQLRSLESFRLGSTVLGILGGISDLPRQSLDVSIGQFIDPLFPGSTDLAPLQFGLKNWSESVAAIRKFDPIAKVSFFDISDSSPIRLDESSMAAKKYASLRMDQDGSDGGS